MQLYGHVDCGVYAEVVSSGALAPGDRFEAEASFQAALPF